MCQCTRDWNRARRRETRCTNAPPSADNDSICTKAMNNRSTNKQRHPASSSLTERPRHHPTSPHAARRPAPPRPQRTRPLRRAQTPHHAPRHLAAPPALRRPFRPPRQRLRRRPHSHPSRHVDTHLLQQPALPTRTLRVEVLPCAWHCVATLRWFGCSSCPQPLIVLRIRMGWGSRDGLSSGAHRGSRDAQHLVALVRSQRTSAPGGLLARTRPTGMEQPCVPRQALI